MMMPQLFTTLVLGVCALLAVSAAPIDQRDVYVPPVLYPNSKTVWKVGSIHNVTWNTSNPPEHITNKKGTIVLAKGDRLLLDNPLAGGFDILVGRWEVQIPHDTVPGDDYSVVLFGDSGNNSQRFEITA